MPVDEHRITTVIAQPKPRRPAFAPKPSWMEAQMDDPSDATEGNYIALQRKYRENGEEWEWIATFDAPEDVDVPSQERGVANGTPAEESWWPETHQNHNKDVQKQAIEAEVAARPKYALKWKAMHAHQELKLNKTDTKPPGTSKLKLTSAKRNTPRCTPISATFARRGWGARKTNSVRIPPIKRNPDALRRANTTGVGKEARGVVEEIIPVADSDSVIAFQWLATQRAHSEI